jgi:hypothetical protein
MSTEPEKLDVLAKLAMDAGRAYQENVRLHGIDKARALHDESLVAIRAVEALVKAARGATCQCPRAHLDMHQKDCHLDAAIPKALEAFSHD